MLHAYLKAQAAHKVVHKLTQAFEQDSSDAEITSRLAEAQRLLYLVEQLIKP